MITGRIFAGAATAVLAACVMAMPGAALASNPAPGSSGPSVTGRPYPGDPAKEAAMVAAEDQRIYRLRAITAAARWQGIATTTPYQVTLDTTPNLVLVAQTQPYTLASLEALIPGAFVRQPDGSYLLTDNIVVEAGAVLDLSSPDGVTIHLASSSKGFVSIIGLGGSLKIFGTAQLPVKIGSWDQTLGTVDTNTADGRAYLRIIGGTANFSYVDFDNLGFWSGGTGGIALTGTAVTASALAKTASPPPPPLTKSVHGAIIKPLTPTGNINDVASAISGDSGGYSYVTANLSHVSIVGNAYGLFVNGSNGVDVTDTHVSGSLVDGIVFHRFVTNSTISATTVNDNAVDGFAMTRASTGILIKGLTANNNGRDGIVLDGGPLANGPNASGTPVGSYGNNSIENGLANSNARYGINVIGGNGVNVVGNSVNNNSMGIAVSKAATAVTIRGNRIKNSIKHAISLVGVTNSTVAENVISGADIGIYLRGASAKIERNVLSGVSNHGITLIGSDPGATISGNTVAGAGPSAIDTARATGAVTQGNSTSNWTNTKPLSVILAGIFQPLTIVWICLGLIVLISALSGIGRKNIGFRHPYANQVPLARLTRGVVRPEELGLTVQHSRVSKPPSKNPRTNRDLATRRRELRAGTSAR